MAADQSPELPQVDAATAKQWLDGREAMLLDVREAPEFAYENVPGSVLLPLSILDPATFPPIAGSRIIVMCAMGGRSKKAQARLAEAGIGPVYNLVDGLAAWKQAGYPTQAGSYEEIDFSI